MVLFLMKFSRYTYFYFILLPPTSLYISYPCFIITTYPIFPPFLQSHDLLFLPPLLLQPLCWQWFLFFYFSVFCSYYRIYMYSFISKAMKRVPSNERACDVCLYGYELPHSIEYNFFCKIHNLIFYR